MNTDQITKAVIETFLLTEYEAIEIIATLIRNGISLATMGTHQAINYIMCNIKVYNCRLYAWMDCKHNQNKEEFSKTVYDLRSGKCFTFINVISY